MSTRYARLLFLVTASTLVTLGGCVSGRAAPPNASAAAAAPVPAVLGGHAGIAGHSREGRPIPYRVCGDGPVRVMIIATIHGDEPAGTPLVEALEEHLRARPQLCAGRTVILVPIANPDGHAARSRGNAKRVDLNRNFPSSSFKAGARHGKAPLSEPESRALDGLLHRFRPDRIVSIHQPLRCVDYDGPETVRDLAAAMAKAGDLPVRKLGARPGSLGSYAGLTLQVPVITLELPGGVSRHDRGALWERYGNLLVAAIRYPEPASPLGRASVE